MKKTFWHLIFIVLLTVSVWTVSYFDSKGFRVLWTLIQEHRKIQKDISHMRDELERTKAVIKAFETDRVFQERVVRSHTGYVADGEMLVEWVEKGR